MDINSENNISIELHRNIGYLTYAVATSFESIQRERILFLKNDLLKSWYYIHPEEKLEEKDSILQTELIFNWLLSHGFSSRFAWDRFKEFVTDYQIHLTILIKENIIQYTEAIASKLYKEHNRLRVVIKVRKILFAEMQ